MEEYPQLFVGLVFFYSQYYNKKLILFYIFLPTFKTCIGAYTGFHFHGLSICMF